MKRYLTTLVLVICAFTLFGQDKIILTSGEIIKGVILEKNDSLVIIETNRIKDYNVINMKLEFQRSQIKKIIDSSEKKGKNVTVNLVGGSVISGRLISKTKDEIVLTNIKGLDIDTLTIKQRQIEKLKMSNNEDRKTFFDIGLLRGGALIGGELEFVIQPNYTFFLGGGIKGYAVGLNVFPNTGFTGLAFKVGYFHQGIGESYSGSYVSSGMSMKTKVGFTFDLGLGFIVDRGRYNYGGQNLILTYGVGWRF